MKNYETPVLEEVEVEIEDIIAKSGLNGLFGFEEPGDKKGPWGGF